MVVDGVTPIQGDGNAVHRAKQDRWVTCNDDELGMCNATG